VRRHLLRKFLGYWGINRLIAGLPPSTRDQEQVSKSTEIPGLAYLQVDDPRDSEFDSDARNDASAYICDHLSRLPVVAVARVARVFGVFRPEQDVNFDIFSERRGHWPSWTGAWIYYGLLPLATYALVIMRKRRIPISPPVAMFAMVAITVAVAMGITQHRVGVHVTLVFLGRVAISDMVQLVRDTRRAPSKALATGDDGAWPAATRGTAPVGESGS
jgi:hypothetical protein